MKDNVEVIPETTIALYLDRYFGLCSASQSRGLVCFGSGADVQLGPSDVRYSPESGQRRRDLHVR
jgi:hypothetical protein